MLLNEDVKQVIVVRKDINLSAGKTAAQCAHAAVECFRSSPPNLRKKWLVAGQKKVILAAKGLEEILKIKEKAKKMKLNFSLVKDAGLTEIPTGTITCVGIGPAPSKDIDKITGSLPLLD